MRRAIARRTALARLSLASWLLLVALPAPSLAAPLSYHVIGNIRPPYEGLPLRTEPSNTGKKVADMPNETVLEVLERLEDGWWLVRDTSNDLIGWALSRTSDGIWIQPCGTYTDAVDSWTEFSSGGRALYYSPNSIARCRNIVSVKWHNGDLSTGKLSIFGAELDCTGDTWRLLFVEQIDRSGTTSTINVRPVKARRELKNTIGEPLSQQVCPLSGAG